MPSENRALFLSLRPRFAEMLLQRTKTVELRRVRPAIRRGSRVLLYATSPTCALVGTGVVNMIDVAAHEAIWQTHGRFTGLERDEFDRYFSGSPAAVAISLDEVQRLADPVPLSDLRRDRDWFRPPQSFRYLDDEQMASLGFAVTAAHSTAA